MKKKFASTIISKSVIIYDDWFWLKMRFQTYWHSYANYLLNSCNADYYKYWSQVGISDFNAFSVMHLMQTWVKWVYVIVVTYFSVFIVTVTFIIWLVWLRQYRIGLESIGFDRIYKFRTIWLDLIGFNSHPAFLTGYRFT